MLTRQSKTTIKEDLDSGQSLPLYKEKPFSIFRFLFCFCFKFRDIQTIRLARAVLHTRVSKEKKIKLKSPN